MTTRYRPVSDPSQQPKSLPFKEHKKHMAPTPKKKPCQFCEKTRAIMRRLVGRG